MIGKRWGRKEDEGKGERFGNCLQGAPRGLNKLDMGSDHQDQLPTFVLQKRECRFQEISPYTSRQLKPLLPQGVEEGE